MSRIRQHRSQQPPWIAGLLLLLLWLFSPAAMADEAQQRLVMIGAKLFPAVMAAYEGLTLRSDTDVHILLLHNGDEARAEQIAATLNEVKHISGLPIRLSLAHYDQLDEHARKPPQGIFLVEPNSQALPAVIRFSEHHELISFSPFRGDVERGIFAGMQISDRVLPLINQRTLSRLPHGMKPFFLRIAISHEP